VKGKEESEISSSDGTNGDSVAKVVTSPFTVVGSFGVTVSISYSLC